MSDYIDPFDLDDAEFEEIINNSGIKGPKPDILLGTINLKGTVNKLSFSFSEKAIARLVGWPRFMISWNSKNFILRIRAVDGGKYEAYELKTGRPSKERRFILRVPMPEGLIHVPKLKEPAPHKYSDKDDKTLNIQIPPAFRQPAPKLLEGPDNKVNQGILRQLAPAPNYSTRKP